MLGCFLQMSEAAAAAAPAKATVEKIASLMTAMNRPALLELLGLKHDRAMVGDVEDLHPITIYQKKTLSIDAWRVPFLARVHADHVVAMVLCCQDLGIKRLC